MNGKVIKKIKEMAAGLPAVYISQKIDSIVYGKELLKTMELFDGELIIATQKYKITKQVTICVNHYNRMKLLYPGGGFMALHRYCEHAKATGKRQANEIKNKVLIVPKLPLLKTIVNAVKKFFGYGSKAA